jgi:CheY-like chemotaxis protein/anti-sigma regulatory factor (Ser/Thr protein kinase)
VQKVQLASVIQAALETAEPAALARHITLRKVLDPGVAISGDPGRLQQVFWNLFSNAVKFTPKQGSVRVVMQRVNSHIEVSVTDTGQGMSAEFIAHAFERFRQSDSTSTQNTSGLGLGLSLVKYLVEMHGGSIEAHSEGEGRGSTFVVRLPVLVSRGARDHGGAHPQAALTSAPRIEPDVNLAGIKVVVVDDDDDAREMLWHMLVASGAEVTAAGSAAEALHAIRQVRPDIILSDVNMPREDGHQLIRKVRMLGDGIGNVPAIALTALSRLEDRTLALLAGYQIHLAKPIDARELVVTVASLVGRVRPVLPG